MLAVGALILVLITASFSPRRLLAPALVAAIGISSFSASTEAIYAIVGAYMVAWFIAGVIALDE